jgi:hypothetical protein
MVKKAVYYITHWEEWHWLAKYFVIGPVWLWLCMKARSLWFFTTSNPTITFGGFTGEAKSEIYKQLPPGTYPVSVSISPSQGFNEIAEQMQSCGLSFPVAVKPDVGMMGFMFRKVESLNQLKQYHELMPVNYFLQQWVDYPIEVSVFYYRYPDSPKGHITGFVKKEYLQVTGDGQSTLGELIENYPRVQFMIKEMRSKHADRLHEVIPSGEVFYLSHALNLSRGGKLVSLEEEKDERLLSVFDELSHYTGFLYGRYDIKCASIGDLKCGMNYLILEYNGCGAEAHHVYGNNSSFFQACKILIDHWNILFKISLCNRRNGLAAWPWRQGATFIRNATKHNLMLRDLDESFCLEGNSPVSHRIPDPALSHHWNQLTSTLSGGSRQKATA